ncbi:hypothetical protein TNCV_3584631 [Trichonephila clavipes]|nr:hypothetical protein TNCV_3584631 [Trichonephila clavipes]
MPVKSVEVQCPPVGRRGRCQIRCRPRHLTMRYRTLDCNKTTMTVTAGSDVVQSGRPIFDDFFQHLWPYIGNNTENVVFQMVKRLWLIRIDQ